MDNENKEVEDDKLVLLDDDNNNEGGENFNEGDYPSVATLENMPDKNTNPADYEDWVQHLSPELLDEVLKAEGSKTSKNDDDDEDPAEPGTDFDEAFLSTLPEKAQSKFKEMQDKLDRLKDFDDDEVVQGMQAFAADPIIQKRIKELSGEVSVSKKSISEVTEAISNLDFRFSPVEAKQKLEALLTEHAQSIESGIHNELTQQATHREQAAKFENEMKGIMTTIGANADGLAWNDPKHPLKDFFDWSIQNAKSVDIMSIGGLNAYSLFLNMSGKSGDILSKVQAKAREDVLKKLNNNKSGTAKTLPRSVSGVTTPGDNQFGIDVNRFKTDHNYQDATYRKLEKNPAAEKFMMKLIS